MSEPIIRDLHLDQLSLECNGSGSQKCLQVELARDEKLDSLAVKNYDSFSGSGLVSPGSQGSTNTRRKRQTFAIAFNQLRSGEVTSDRKRMTRTLANASCQDGCEQPDTQEDSGSRKTLNTASGQDSGGKTTLDRKNRQTLDNSSNKCGSELDAVSASSRCCTYIFRNDVAKDDFMALLSLSPSHVTLRARKCTLHRLSKYLHIKSRYLWNKICGEGNYRNSTQFPDTKAVPRPCYVLLKRSNVIDCLARQPNPGSIFHKSFKANSKAANHRKLLINARGKSILSHVVLKRDSNLDQLALQISNVMCTSHTSNSSETNIVSPCEAKLKTTTPLSTHTTFGHAARMAESPSSNYPGTSPFEAKPTSTVPFSTNTTISHASEKPGCRMPFVKITRDSGLDMFVVQNSNLMAEPPSSNSPGVSVVSPCMAELTSTVPLSTHTTISHASEEPGRQRPFVKITRDTILDTLALKNSNLMAEPLSSNSPGSSVVSPFEADELTSKVPTTISHVLEKPDLKKLLIKVNKNSDIYQLAWQNPSTAVIDCISGCNNSTVPYHLKQQHLPTSKLPLDFMASIPTLTKLPGECMDDSLDHSCCKAKLGSNPETHYDSKIPVSKRGVIKLRRISCGDWSVIQPEGPNHADVGLERNEYEGFQTQSSNFNGTVSKSTGSKSASTMELISNPFIGLLALPTSNSGRTEGGFCHKTPSHDIHSANQPTLPQCSSKQTMFKTGPVFRSSARKSFKEVLSVPSVSCTKSIPSKEGTPLEVRHNENKNPQKHVVPPVKTVAVRRKRSTTIKVVKPLILRRICTRVAENDSLGKSRAKSRASRRKDHHSNYNFEKPSISRCMSIKKPLGQQSPNSTSM